MLTSNPANATSRPRRRPRASGWSGSDLLGGGSVTLLTAGVAVGGGLTGDFRSAWYHSLQKPRWQPSGRVIGGVWAVLYTSIAVAGCLLWRDRRRAGPDLAALFVGQSVLNAAWTPLFTRFRSLDAAWIECGVLTLVNVALVARAWRVRREAALLLVPYTCWTGFATFLSWSVARLNPDR